MDNQIQVLLLFPPVWSPETPYLSTPVLTSYLRSQSISAIQRDLNIKYWSYLTSSEKIADIYKKLHKKWEELQYKQNLSDHERCLQTTIAGVKELDLASFIAEVQAGIIDRQVFQQIIHGVNGFSQDHSPYNSLHAQNAKKQLKDYYDPLFWNISFSQYAMSSEELAYFVSDHRNNPFFEFFQNELSKEISASHFDIVGISIVAPNQVVPAFTIAKILKNLKPHIHIVIGGNWCTQVHNRLGPVLDRFDYIDSIAIFEGEETLLKLCKAVRKKGDLVSVPNLYFKRQGSVISTGRTESSLNMNDLPTPVFDGLPLDKYDFAKSLPLQASRGCYWGHCTFCSYKLLEPKYKLRDTLKVVSDMSLLRNRHNAASFMFTDAAISPSYAKQLAQTMLMQNIVSAWVAFARFDKGFTPDLLSLMARSGCQQISWGLESANQRILQIINKSIDIEAAEAILQASAAAGICNRLLVMYGHPTERISEAWDTIKFVHRNIKCIHSLSWNYYHPEHNTGIENVASEHALKLESDSQNDLTFSYLWDSRLSVREKNEICDSYRTISDQIYLWRGNYKEDVLTFIEEITNNDDKAYCVTLPEKLTKRKVFSYLSQTDAQRCSKRRFFEVVDV